jgi:hypothetical protein
LGEGDVQEHVFLNPHDGQLDIFVRGTSDAIDHGRATMQNSSSNAKDENM